MPNSLTPLPPATAETEFEIQSDPRLPWRKRIVTRINGFDVNVPTRTRVPARSVTPIY
ncbi:MAG: hypothetical protein AAGF25_14775 [Pseudomonadota bacterium]